MATRKKCNNYIIRDIMTLVTSGSIEMLKKRRVQWSKLYNYTDVTGQGLLATSIISGSYPMVEYLLDKGFDIEFKSKFSKYTPVMTAASLGSHKILSLLIERGANIHATDIFGRNALLFAASCGYIANTTLLLEKGSSLTATDQDGNTPLHCAAISENLDIFKLLIDKGASTQVKNKVGKTPLDLVKHKWNYQEYFLYIKNKK
jgi:ankyrin repeat protein